VQLGKKKEEEEGESGGRRGAGRGEDQLILATHQQ